MVVLDLSMITMFSMRRTYTRQRLYTNSLCKLQPFLSQISRFELSRGTRYPELVICLFYHDGDEKSLVRQLSHIIIYAVSDARLTSD